VGAFAGQSCANGTKWEGRARTQALPPSPLPYLAAELRRVLEEGPK
jgi:hypothetical protein